MAKFLIGFTQSDRENDYVVSIHGYRGGAKQIELLVQIPDRLISEEYSAYRLAEEDWIKTHPRSAAPSRELEWTAEQFFEATNAPYEFPVGTLSRYFQETLLEYSGYIRSMSTGDTFSRVDFAMDAFVNPNGVNVIVIETTVCQSVGWEAIDISADRNPIIYVPAFLN